MSARDSLFSLRPTNRARVLLLLTPIILPLAFLVDGLGAIPYALKEWWSVSGWNTTAIEWYRDVYRPARYGSVWDDLDENGYPTAWNGRPF